MSDAYRERARRWLVANVAHHPHVDYDHLMNLAAEFETIAREVELSRFPMSRFPILAEALQIAEEALEKLVASPVGITRIEVDGIADEALSAIRKAVKP